MTLVGPVYSNSSPIPSETLYALERIKSLHDNWDGDGASRIDLSTVDKVEQLIRESYMVAPKWLNPPSVAPGFGGMIVVEWSGLNGQELILDIHAGDGPTRFLLVERSPDGGHIETDEYLRPPWSIHDLMVRLTNS